MAKKVDDEIAQLPPELRDALMRNDFASYARLVFRTLKPNEQLLWAPYLDLLCAALQEVAEGKTSRLIITIPPRFLKSILGSVALPTFFLGHNPSAEVMCVSYGQDLAKEFGEARRLVMASEEYKSIFETRLASERAAPVLVKTQQGGVCRATSIDGTATGLGSHLTIFDDPQKAGEAPSDAIRRSTNSAYENTFVSRQNDPKNQRIVIIMQRLHEDDFVGHVLGLGGDWKVINLPAIALTDEVWRYETFLGAHDWCRKAGESLHPERFPLSALAKRRADVGEAVWATQYEMNPTPADGGIVKPGWFKRIRQADLPREFSRVIQSWDTANTVEEYSNYSVCTTWGELGDKLYLIDVYRERLLYPDLKRAVLERAKTFSATVVLIEKKASGMQLLQELPQGPLPIAQEVKPEGDKKMRMASQTSRLEKGDVYIVEDAHWTAAYLHELTVFPNGKHNDQVDSTSQAFAWITNTRIPFWNVYEFTRLEAEALAKPAEEEIWVLQPPHRYGEYQLMGGGSARCDADGLLRVPRADGVALTRRDGYKRVGYRPVRAAFVKTTSAPTKTYRSRAASAITRACLLDLLDLLDFVDVAISCMPSSNSAIATDSKPDVLRAVAGSITTAPPTSHQAWFQREVEWKVLSRLCRRNGRRDVLGRDFEGGWAPNSAQSACGRIC